MASVDIIVPAARGMEHETLQSIQAMARDAIANKHSVRIMPTGTGNRVVHWSRNTMIALALYGHPANPPADYFWLVDDDMVGKPGDLTRLLSYKAQKRIVTGIATKRIDPPVPNIRMWNAATEQHDERQLWDFDSNKLFEVDAVGAAYMLVPRILFEEMAEAYLKCFFERQEDKRKFPRCDDVDAFWDKKEAARRKRFDGAVDAGKYIHASCYWFEFKQNFVDGQAYEWGEDIAFCWKARQLGYKIFADPQVTPEHMGMYGYGVKDYRQYVDTAFEAGTLKQIAAGQ